MIRVPIIANVLSYLLGDFNLKICFCVCFQTIRDDAAAADDDDESGALVA